MSSTPAAPPQHPSRRGLFSVRAPRLTVPLLLLAFFAWSVLGVGSAAAIGDGALMVYAVTPVVVMGGWLVWRIWREERKEART